MKWLRRRIGGGEREPEVPMLDPEVAALMAAHGLAAFDRQLALSDILGGLDWSMDQGTGQMRFGTEISVPSQILGSTSDESGTWLWAWANPSIEEALTVRARELRALGEEQGIALLTQPQLDVEAIGGGHLLTLAVTGLLDADAYYRGPRELGETWILLQMPEVRRVPADPEQHIAELVPQFISLVGLGPSRAGVVTYLRSLGVPFTDDGTEIRVGTDGATAFAFDELGRIVEFRGRRHA